MTGPIRGNDGFPRTDIVQPVSPVHAVNKDTAKKEELLKEQKPAVESAQDTARRHLQEVLNLQARAEKAQKRGGIDEQA